MRILVVEDNEALGALLVQGLAARGFGADLVTTASDARNALALVHFAAVILDLGLRDGDGLALLRDVRATGLTTPVLILTARGGLQDRVTGLRSGADDYLAKPFELEELVARIEALLRRPGELLGHALRAGNITFDVAARQVTVDAIPQLLSARELAVLEILMRRAGRVVPRKVLEDQLFGFSSEIGSNAAEVYVHRLRRQLAAAGANVSVHTVRGVGYLIDRCG